MIQMLQEAFDRVADLPPEEQERFAKLVLAELDMRSFTLTESFWSRLFNLPASQMIFLTISPGEKRSIRTPSKVGPHC